MNLLPLLVWRFSFLDSTHLLCLYLSINIKNVHNSCKRYRIAITLLNCSLPFSIVQLQTQLFLICDIHCLFSKRAWKLYFFQIKVWTQVGFLYLSWWWHTEWQVILACITVVSSMQLSQAVVKSVGAAQRILLTENAMECIEEALYIEDIYFLQYSEYLSITFAIYEQWIFTWCFLKWQLFEHCNFITTKCTLALNSPSFLVLI